MGCGKGVGIENLRTGAVLLAGESLTSSVWCGLCLRAKSAGFEGRAGKEMGRGGQKEGSQRTLSREEGSSTGRQVTHRFWLI